MCAGRSFYRAESCFSRDLAVLSAVVQRRQRQQQLPPQHPPSGDGSPAALPLHVADLMAGSGIRSLRYLLQAGADHGDAPARRARRPSCPGARPMVLGHACASAGACRLLCAKHLCLRARLAPPAVLCNEGDLANAPCLEANLAAAAEARGAAAGSRVESSATPGGGMKWRLRSVAAAGEAGGAPVCELTHEDALR